MRRLNEINFPRFISDNLNKVCITPYIIIGKIYIFSLSHIVEIYFNVIKYEWYSNK